jgi:glycosyltransferase involved in cell wall biosynthesis
VSLNVAIDAAELESRLTGVGRYLERLLQSWLSVPGTEQFTLLHRGGLEIALPRSQRLTAYEIPRGLLAMPLWREQMDLPRALRRLNPNVLFAPAYVKPLRWRGRTVLTIHDLSYEAFPEWFSAVHGARMRWIGRRSAREADAIIAVSEFTRNEIVDRYRIERERIRVIHHGIDPSLREAPFTSEQELRDAIGMPRPFVLSVGSIFERRYPMELISAFRHLTDLDLGLVIVGDDRRKQPGNLEEHIAESGLSDRVRWLRYAKQADVLGLYRAAEALIHLSAYEGFGLPPLEAMSFGLPAIVSARGALLEVYGESAALVHDEHPEAIAGVVRRVVSDHEYRTALVERGTDRVKSLGLSTCADQTLQVIREAAGTP